MHNVHSLLAYSQANRAVLRLRDQKQLDFEELSDYLSQLSLERDRLAARSGLGGGVVAPSGLGLGAYLRDRVDAIRGTVDDDRTRVEKMKKLDGKIKEVMYAVVRVMSGADDRVQLEAEVTAAHDTSNAFSSETLKEQKVFEHAKRAEMKEILGDLVDGQIEMYRQVRSLHIGSAPGLISRIPGYQGVGFYHSRNATNPSRRVVICNGHYFLDCIIIKVLNAATNVPP